MNKNGGNIELKIYELLGIKTFRKMAFKLRDLLWIPLTPKKSKEERHEMLYNEPSNYIMKKGHGIEDLRDFKKQLLINTSIHIGGLIIFIPNFLKIIVGTASLFATITTLLFVTINIYCIMLQRYNHIRINQVIKKKESREEAKKCELKEELIKEDALLGEHTYKVVNLPDKEKDITFEELLENATYEQLKLCRVYLSYVKKMIKMMDEQQSYCTLEEQPSITVQLEKYKKLKLELKPKKQNESAN